MYPSTELHSPLHAAAFLCCSLMLACYAGHLDVVKYLRRHGASWDARDLGGCTALHWAADGGHCPVIDWMIKDGCEVGVCLVNHTSTAKILKGCSAGSMRSQVFKRWNLEMLEKNLWLVMKKAPVGPGAKGPCAFYMIMRLSLSWRLELGRKKKYGHTQSWT